jgi:hypothetical protein
MEIYRVSQEERSIFWEVTISLILSKEVYMYMCPIPNGFRDTAVLLYSTLYTVQTSNTPSSDFIGDRTRDLRACSIVFQPTTMESC